MTSERTRVELRVHGRVQGVSYRAYAREKAQRLGLSGWVANDRDGTVAVVAEGPRAAVEAFVAWCRRGSPSAEVASVDETWLEPVGETGDFAVRHRS